MTTLTRELERTRNGAKIMERTLEAAKVDIARLREDYSDSQDRIKELRVFAQEVALGAYKPYELRSRAAALLEKS